MARRVDFDYINNSILVNDEVGIPAVLAAPGRLPQAAVPPRGAMLIFTFMNAGNLELLTIVESGELRDMFGQRPLTEPAAYMADTNAIQTAPIALPVDLPNMNIRLNPLLVYLNGVTYADLNATRAHYLAVDAALPVPRYPHGFDISLGGTIIKTDSRRLKCYHRYYNPNGQKGFIGGTRKAGETPVQNAIREFMEETGIEGLLNKFNLRNDWDNQLIFREAGFTDIGVNALGRNVIIYNCNDLEKGILERIYHSFRRDVGYPEFHTIAGLRPLINDRSKDSLDFFNNWLAGRNLAVALAATLAAAVPPVVLGPLPVLAHALPALPLVNDRTILNAEVALQISRHGGYYKKYLKYKQKYQELKEKLNGGLIEPSALLPAGRFLDDDVHNASISRRWAESLLAGSINYAFQGNIIIFTDNRPLVTSIRDDRIIIGDDEYYFIENVNAALLHNLINERLCKTIIRKIPVVDVLRFITLKELLDELRLRGVAVPVNIRVDVFYINRTI